ncbi:MAG: porin family protein [Salinivirgaceae bacterium]|jgi:opacity protein-like surface antigen|nr:PorT family protein [Bacteroidales bacterium]
MRNLVTIAIFFSLVLCFNNKLKAQHPFRFGFSFGVITSQLDGDGYGGYNKSGLQGGAWVSRSFADNFAYMLEIAYRPKGSKSSFNATDEEPDYYKLKLHYVEVPVTLRYYYDRYVFDISAGIAYLAKEREEGYISGFVQSSDITGFNDFDFVVAAGIGIKFNEYWSVKARFTYSAFDAAKKYIPPKPVVHNGQYNNDLSISLYRTIGN